MAVSFSGSLLIPSQHCGQRCHYCAQKDNCISIRFHAILMPVLGDGVMSRAGTRIVTVLIEFSPTGLGLDSTALYCCSVRVILSCMLFLTYYSACSCYDSPQKNRGDHSAEAGRFHCSFSVGYQSFRLNLTSPTIITNPTASRMMLDSSGTGATNPSVHAEAIPSFAL